jgi:hypothetical protein
MPLLDTDYNKEKKKNIPHLTNWFAEVRFVQIYSTTSIIGLPVCDTTVTTVNAMNDDYLGSTSRNQRISG